MWTPRFMRRDRTVIDPATGLAYVDHVPAADPAYREAAYREGRVDQRRDDEKVERVERRRHPVRNGFGLVGLLIVLLAVAGGAYLTLSAREGSFAAGGAAIDRQVSAVTTPARDAAAEAVDRTGYAVQQAGEKVENTGKKLREKVD
jgi:hypothetical protein